MHFAHFTAQTFHSVFFVGCFCVLVGRFWMVFARHFDRPDTRYGQQQKINATCVYSELVISMAERERERESGVKKRLRHVGHAIITYRGARYGHVCVFVFGQTLSLANYNQRQNSILFVGSCLTIQNRQHFTAGFYLYIDFTIVAAGCCCFIFSTCTAIHATKLNHLYADTQTSEKNFGQLVVFFLSSSLLLSLWWLLLLLLLFISYCLRQCLFVRFGHSVNVSDDGQYLRCDNK